MFYIFSFQKCYKRFYKNKNSPGTLHYFKTLLHWSNVNGTVKGIFRPHHDLLMVVGESLIKEQFIEYFKMETIDTKPEIDLLTSTDEKTMDETKDQFFTVITEFIDHYGYCKVDTDQSCPKDLQNVQCYQLCTVDNQIVLVPYTTEKKSDELFNYSRQLCHWYMHLVEMNDTAKEGDLNRAILNCQYSLPFFFSHSTLNKYLVENIDYILKCEHLLSPLQRIQAIPFKFPTRGWNAHEF